MQMKTNAHDYKASYFFLRNFLIITQYQEPSKSILLPPHCITL